MSAYRRKTTSGRSRFWTAEFEHGGRKFKRGKFVDKKSAEHWKQEQVLLAGRTGVGYVKPMTQAQVVPLIDIFGDSLTEKDCDPHYVYVTTQRLKRLAAECGWNVLGAITRDSLEEWAASDPEWRGKKIGARTRNQMIEAAVQFGKWLASSRVKKLARNPLAETERQKAKLNENYRRAATIEEINLLLSKCQPGRKLYYLFRLYCPLRGKTIAALTWGMLKLDGSPPWIELPAAINKSRRIEKSPLRADIAHELSCTRIELEREGYECGDESPVFPYPPSLDDFKADLAAAGVPFCDEKGNRRFDYHAMRKTLVRLLAKAGVSLEKASKLLHHKDIATTRKHYNESAPPAELGESMEQLPKLGEINAAEQPSKSEH